MRPFPPTHVGKAQTQGSDGHRPCGPADFTDLCNVPGRRRDGRAGRRNSGAAFDRAVYARCRSVQDAVRGLCRSLRDVPSESDAWGDLRERWFASNSGTVRSVVWRRSGTGNRIFIGLSCRCAACRGRVRHRLEAGGIEPPSRNISDKASTCVVGLLVSTARCRPTGLCAVQPGLLCSPTRAGRIRSV